MRLPPLSPRMFGCILVSLLFTLAMFALLVVLLATSVYQDQSSAAATSISLTATAIFLTQ